jgi:hypothetical protein
MAVCQLSAIAISMSGGFRHSSLLGKGQHVLDPDERLLFSVIYFGSQLE